MEYITLQNQYYTYTMIEDNGELRHLSFLPAGYDKQLDPDMTFQRTWPCSPEAVIVVNSESYMQPHGKRAYFGGVSQRSRFVGREEVKVKGGVDHIMILSDPETELETRLHYVVYDDSPAMHRYTELVNRGKDEVIVNHVSSFCLGNFPYFTDDMMRLKLHRFRSCWIYEGNHYVNSLPELEVYRDSRNAFVVESIGTWVCKDHIPFFIIEQEEEKLFTAVQIEISQSWRFELGNGEPRPTGAWLYAQGGLGNETHAGWSCVLKPGDAFVSPKVSLAVAEKTYENALNMMHTHRERVLIHRSEGDRGFPVIYNDWLYLLGKNNEQAILRQLDTLQENGVEVYVTDDGWHVPTSLSLWEGLGHWEPDRERFPHGLRYVADAIKAHGMKPGIWCEIEGIGEKAEHYHDESMLLMRNGRFVTDAGHRFLNFTKPKVRAYADKIFDRFAEWGFEYVKIDYNSDSVPGADNCGSDNPAEGIRLNREAYDAWLDGVRARHPQMIIENCSSGGMRLEYNSLSRSDMSSITDHSDFKLLGAHAYNVTKVIHPSQCGVWSWTDCSNSLSDFALTMTNSMVGRMHLCGDFASLSGEKRKLLNDACALYKKYRHMLNSCTMRHHTDPIFYYRNTEKIRCLEMRSGNNTEAVVVAQRPGCEADTITVLFPDLVPGDYSLEFFPHRAPITVGSKDLAEKGYTFHFDEVYAGALIYLKKL